MTQDNVYQYDVREGARQAIPPVLRENVMLATASWLLTHLVELFEDFKAARAAALAQLTYTGQVIQMERYLNNLYYSAWNPNGTNPITILDGPGNNILRASIKDESIPIVFGTQSTNQYARMPIVATGGTSQPAFTVRVPSTLSYVPSQLIAQIKLVSPAGMPFTIVTY
jgi:hypothetical protein